MLKEINRVSNDETVNYLYSFYDFDGCLRQQGGAAVREAARKEQLGEYVKRHHLNVRYYQDFGWDAVALQGE